ncbi:hypothetical protein PLICRDRAFT_699867 [Plicaturopsis crispa FD-325 SS-3]|nr:hypothetical protein PLICRDRAFT_699867 [Plicaturopsis crispa FD-325 SS-3]
MSLVDAKPPLPPYLAGATDLSLAVLVALSHTLPAPLLAAGFVAFTVLSSYGWQYTVGDAWLDYGVGGTFMIGIFTAVQFLFLSDTLTTIHHKDDRGPALQKPFLSRVWWALCLKQNIRGIGWNIENAHIPPASKTSRRHFVLVSLARAAVYWLIADVSQAYLHANPLFSLRGPDAVPITSQGPFLQALNIIAWWATPYGLTGLAHSLLAASSVAVGMYPPSAWPAFFGAWSDAYTLRRFWSRTWHHLVRRICVAYGKAVARALALKPGTKASAYTQLYVAFIVSSIVHSVGDYTIDPARMGTSAPFFLIQAVVITAEDAAIGLGRMAGLRGSRAWKLLGYVWVAGWFFVMVPPLSWMYAYGVGEVLPGSIIRPLWRAWGPRLEIDWKVPVNAQY